MGQSEGEGGGRDRAVKYTTRGTRSHCMVQFECLFRIVLFTV